MSTAPTRTVRFHEHGEPAEVLVEERVDAPDPGEGRVRVRVTAVGLNPADWELCRGFLAGSLPRGIGLEVAGVVDAIGSGVDDVAEGDPLLGWADFLGQPSAGLADVAILDHWAPLPAALDPVRAAALPMAAQTAAWTLDAMGVGGGTVLLVHGAGSTVGFAAVQIARRRGARVLATAGGTFAADLEGFGAAVTPYGDGMVDRVRAIADGPIGLVLDTAPPSPEVLPQLIELAGAPSRVVTIADHEAARRLGARSNLDLITAPEPPERILREYAALAAEGAFRIPIARTLPFDGWREAVEASLSGRARGKLVVLPQG